MGRQEEDLKEVLRKEEELRQKLAELYPEKEFPNDILSPQVGIWLSKQTAPFEIKELISRVEGGAAEEEIKKMEKRAEVFQLWHECYMSQNS